MHAPLSPAFRVEWRGLDALAGRRRRVARARRPRARAQRVLRAGLRARGSAGVRRRRRRGAGVVGGRPADRSVPGADRARRAARARRSAGPIRSRRSARRWSTATTPEAVIAAWLDHLARDPSMPALLLLPLVPEHGRLRGGARRGAGAQRPPPAPRSAAISARCSRPAREREDYLERAMSAGRRKELRRQRRRLEEIAPVTFATGARRGRDRRRAEGFPGAGGERLEGPRRHRRRRTIPPSGASCETRGAGARGRRPRAHRPAVPQRPRHRRRDHACERRHRLVLEDRLQRRPRPLLARACSSSRDCTEQPAGGAGARARQFLRHRRPSR